MIFTVNYNKRRLFIILAVALLFVCSSGCSMARIPEVHFWDNLDTVALSVEDEEYTLRELALYIAYEEALVEEQAKVYDPANPLSYWNVHTNGEFIRVRARNEARDMAVNDAVFTEVGHEYGVRLDPDETGLAISRFEDFWSDLTDEQQELLEDIYDDLESTAVSMAYAEKSRQIYASSEDIDEEELIKEDSPEFDEICKKYKIRIEENIWKGIGFGKVTIIR